MSTDGHQTLSDERIYVGFPAEDIARIRKAARMEMRSLSAMVRVLVRESLDAREEQK